MPALRPDLPFERDGSSRFLPLIVALMVFLATLATAGTLALENAIAGWNAALAGRLTVQVPAPEAGAASASETAAVMTRLTAMIADAPGIAEARALDGAETRALVAPWLGDVPADGALLLPGLIDVRLEPGAVPDAAGLEARLGEVVPGVAVDDHRAWLAGLFDLARTVEVVAMATVAVIAVSAAAAVVFVTRGGLAVHRPIVELLHLMGAHDGYIARQFQHNAFRLALRGALIGGAAAGLVIAAVGIASTRLDSALLTLPAFAGWQWGALAAVPATAVVLAVATARRTVLRALARMP